MKPAAKSLIKSIIDISHVDFSAWDIITGKLIFTSGLSQNILGYPKEQYEKLSNNFFTDIVHPDDLDKVLEDIESLKMSKSCEVLESTARYRNVDGIYTWVYTRRIVSIRDKSGNPIKVTSICEDISETIGLRNELRDKAQRMEKIAIKNSHDVRGFVASIIGILDLIDEKSFLYDYDKQYFNYLKLAVKKLDKVVREINELV
ncbi:MAG: hypothetical protein CMO01_11345 [Thalassobius sp.]|nr:hypothetical protein [Thalassovita sp.]